MEGYGCHASTNFIGKDGGIANWSFKVVSVRKHVAYRLWKERVFTNPAKVCAWGDWFIE